MKKTTGLKIQSITPALTEGQLSGISLVSKDNQFRATIQLVDLAGLSIDFAVMKEKTYSITIEEEKAK